MNIELKNAFDKGYNTFFVDPKVRQHNNPYIPNTIAAKEWLRGYDKAYFDNQRKVVQREIREKLNVSNP